MTKRSLLLAAAAAVTACAQPRVHEQRLTTSPKPEIRQPIVVWADEERNPLDRTLSPALASAAERTLLTGGMLVFPRLTLPYGTRQAEALRMAKEAGAGTVLRLEVVRNLTSLHTPRLAPDYISGMSTHIGPTVEVTRLVIAATTFDLAAPRMTWVGTCETSVSEDGQGASILATEDLVKALLP